ncbi:hypothetical protein ACHAXR_001034, partial [Thalassiosira sp. AJA248-18]
LLGTTTTKSTPTKTTTTLQTTVTQQHALHLVSLPPKNDTFSLPGESLVRECWRWKDSALGDGRDYFVPRPRALKAFHSLFVGMEISVMFGGNELNKSDENDSFSPLEVVLKLPSNNEGGKSSEVRLPLNGGADMDIYDDIQQSSKGFSFSETFVIEECAALSNCARLDVILVLKGGVHRRDTHEVAEKIAARYAVAYHLQQQIVSQRSKNTSLLQRTGLTSWLDLPGAINLEKDQRASSSSNTVEKKQCKEMYSLAERLTSLEGAHSISTHLSLIAGGLAPRPNRPDREVIFRPYSSRDAHILLQLKRTVEVVSVLNAKNNNGGRGRIKTLLDGALSAGKAARNEDVVPDITKLKEYGSDGTPPVALANIVAEVRAK